MTPTTTTTSEKLRSNVYFGLMSLVLASIGIKYQGSNTNPFQQPSLSMLLFLTAISCHTFAKTAKFSFPTVIIFHVSGVAASETLFWILLPQIWKCVIINVVLSFVAVFCFYYTYICELLTKLLQDLEAQESIGAQMEESYPITDLEAQKSIGAQMEDSNPMTDLEAQENIGAQMEDSTVPNTLLYIPPLPSGVIQPDGRHHHAFFLAVFAYLMTLKKEAWLTYVTLIPVVTGVMNATGEKLNSMNLLIYMAPVAVAFLLLASIIMEEDVIGIIFAPSRDDSKMWLRIFNSALAYFVNLTNFLVTKHTSALTLLVLGNAKGAVAVISILIFRNPASVTGMKGYSPTVFGVNLYSEAKKMSKQDT